MLKQISIFVENKGGRLNSITETLYGAEIDIRAISIADTTDFGIVRLIVKDAEKAVTALKNAEFTAKINDVIAFSIPDKAGSLLNITQILEELGVDVDYAYSFMGRRAGEADIVIQTKGLICAEKSLKEAGITLLSESDL